MTYWDLYLKDLQFIFCKTALSKGLNIIVCRLKLFIFVLYHFKITGNITVEKTRKKVGRYACNQRKNM